MGDSKSTLTFLTEDLPEFLINEPYGIWLQADGGTPPYTFELTEGEFPYSVFLSSEGYVSGVPAAGSSYGTVFITLSDVDANKVTQAFDCVSGKQPKGEEPADQ